MNVGKFQKSGKRNVSTMIRNDQFGAALDKALAKREEISKPQFNFGARKIRRREGISKK